MPDYKWSIEKLVVTDGDVVTHVHWRCEAKGFASFGVCDLVLSDSFTDYDQLTEQQVLNWCFEPKTTTFENLTDNTTTVIVKHLKDEGEAQIAEQISRIKNKPALPWAQIPA